jgi:probable rRNA maturation factor
VSVRLIAEHGPHRGLKATEVLRRARAVARALQLTKSELSIVLTNDDTIQKLNATYRHRDVPTDVLAFAMHEGEGGHLAGALLGDVIVSVETARVQAVRAGRVVLEEVTMLVVHGLLHLLGWDHETPAKDVRMRAETARLCRLASKPAGVKRAKPKTSHVSSGRESSGCRAPKRGPKKLRA